MLAGFGMIQSYWMEDYDDDEDEKVQPEPAADLFEAEALGEEDMQQDFTTIEVSDNEQSSLSTN